MRPSIPARSQPIALDSSALYSSTGTRSTTASPGPSTSLPRTASISLPHDASRNRAGSSASIGPIPEARSHLTTASISSRHAGGTGTIHSAGRNPSALHAQPPRMSCSIIRARGWTSVIDGLRGETIRTNARSIARTPHPPPGARGLSASRRAGRQAMTSATAPSRLDERLGRGVEAAVPRECLERGRDRGGGPGAERAEHALEAVGGALQARSVAWRAALIAARPAGRAIPR